MFAHIVNLNCVDNCTTNMSGLVTESMKVPKQLQTEYAEAVIALNEINNEITQNEEQRSIIERDRVKLMSELALQMQRKHDLKNKVEELKSTQLSIEFELKKYQKVKLSTVNLEVLAHIKKIFIIYKNMLKIHFDYFNCGKATTQKGYVYNRITKKLVYFEFNMDLNTSEEISKYLWNKIKSISDKNWEILSIS